MEICSPSLCLAASCNLNTCCSWSHAPPRVNCPRKRLAFLPGHTCTRVHVHACCGLWRVSHLVLYVHEQAHLLCWCWGSCNACQTRQLKQGRFDAAISVIIFKPSRSSLHLNRVMVAVAAWCVFAVRGLVAESTACQVQIPVPRTFEVLFRSLPLQRVACKGSSCCS